MFAWIARDRPAAARGLRESIRSAADRIGHLPEAGTSRPDLGGAGLRVLSLTHCPDLVVHRFRAGSAPSIIRIVHGARDLPGLFGLS